MAKTTKKISSRTTSKTTSKTSKRAAGHFRNIAVVYRPGKPEAHQTAIKIVEWLHQRDRKCFVISKLNKIPGARYIRSSAEMKKIDLCVVIGGDGTYLKAVKLLNGHETPVLGINLGALGFMTETRASEMFKTLELAIFGRLKVQSRTMLQVTIKKKGKAPETFLALNDIVIERGPISKLINLGIYSDDHLVTELKADGLIVCTPTGSTAYNLASSGPIVHPEVHAMVVTPICPHSLTNRPITLPDDQTITIKVMHSTHKAVFMVDGQKRADVRDADEVVVRLSPMKHLRLVHPSSSYFDVLRTKLKFGHRD